MTGGPPVGGFPEPRPGSYVLLLRLPLASRVRVGRLGAFWFSPGWYLYVGSARGPGGVRARAARHLRAGGARRWHLDYLRRVATPSELWYSCDPHPREHSWAQLLARDLGLPAPIVGFGASDCGCPSHLFFSESRPSYPAFRRLLRRRLPGHAPVVRLPL